MASADQPTHRYATRVEWSGSTGVGYESYDRTHTVTPLAGTGVAVDSLTMTADPAFRGRAELVNPEQLLLAAASSCQLLSFLAVAARARLDVIAYTDEADAVMPEDDRPVRITRIVLRPHVTVRGSSVERIERLLHVAHDECFIANSLRSEMVLEPTVEVVR